MNITQKPSPNYGSRGDHKITHIVIHAAVGTLEGTITLFSRKESQVSAHYMVDRDGSIVQFVDENNSAWHVCDANPFCIGIEHTDMFRDAAGHLIGGCDKNIPWTTSGQIMASAQLTAQLCKKYNIPVANVIGHNDPFLKRFRNNHTDPGPLFSMPGYRTRVMEELAKLDEVTANPRGFEAYPLGQLPKNKGGRPPGKKNV
jgi:N-acetyl-anhydromuramyl-L-alanine amidase AmpD